MDFWHWFWVVAAPIILGVLVWGARWLGARYHENNLLVRAFAFVESMGDRARDKYVAELRAAKQPDSDGGVEVTAAELSDIRARVLKDGLASAPTEIAEVIKRDIGEFQAKAIIGKKISEPEAALVGIPVEE